jgi:hypothetical protein
LFRFIGPAALCAAPQAADLTVILLLSKSTGDKRFLSKCADAALDSLVLHAASDAACIALAGTATHKNTSIGGRGALYADKCLAALALPVASASSAAPDARTAGLAAALMAPLATLLAGKSAEGRRGAEGCVRQLHAATPPAAFTAALHALPSEAARAAVLKAASSAAAAAPSRPAAAGGVSLKDRIKMAQVGRAAE